MGFYLRKKQTGHAGGRAGFGWARIWPCWARWVGLGVGFGRAGRAGWVGRGVGRAGRAGWVGRGVGRGVWPCWAERGVWPSWARWLG